jgi:hypothetical protein
LHIRERLRHIVADLELFSGRSEFGCLSINPRVKKGSLRGFDEMASAHKRRPSAKQRPFCARALASIFNESAKFDVFHFWSM